MRGEEGGAEVVEFCRGQAQDGEAGFVGQCGGGVPGLDLLAEDGYEVVGVFVEEGLAEG